MRPPFPGMDPWLEHPAIWPGVHSSLIASIRDELAAKLAPRYFVDIEERVYLVETESQEYLGRPDVVVSGMKKPFGPSSIAGETALSVADYVETEIDVLGDEKELTFRHLEIYDTSNRELITVIELLSPTNKLHHQGRDKYLDKRKTYFEADVNFVEIDLLRSGRRMPDGEKAPSSDYCVLIARKGTLPRAKLRGFNVRQPIPPVPIPLRTGDVEPILDLNVVLHGVYERARYDLRIDYSHPPEPPLCDQDAAWAAEILLKVSVGPPA